jgi:hypothetical protein
MRPKTWEHIHNMELEMDSLTGYEPIKIKSNEYIYIHIYI